MADYVPKPSSKDEPEVMWDAIFTGEVTWLKTIYFDSKEIHAPYLGMWCQNSIWSWWRSLYAQYVHHERLGV